MTNNFILQKKIKNIKICDDLINYFENSKYKQVGKCDDYINKKIKDSTDLGLNVNSNVNCVNLYLSELSKIIEKYKKIYKFSSKYHARWEIIENFNIQKYDPNQGFFSWHFERSHPGSALRHLVFMTYLNDVNDAGETEWYYQKLKIKPKKGLTVIWPVDWTFTHRGITSKSETKYIITGWYSYQK